VVCKWLWDVTCISLLNEYDFTKVQGYSNRSRLDFTAPFFKIRCALLRTLLVPIKTQPYRYCKDEKRQCNCKEQIKRVSVDDAVVVGVVYDWGAHKCLIYRQLRTCHSLWTDDTHRNKGPRKEEQCYQCYDSHICSLHFRLVGDGVHFFCDTLHVRRRSLGSSSQFEIELSILPL
jgi:hypothetical protein